MLRLNITHKISLFSALLVSFTALIIVWVFYTGTSKILVDNALTDISSKIISQGNKLTTHIDSQISDTIFLSQLKDIKSSTRETINNGHVSNIFESLLHSKSDYLQIRYIDNEGNERVRVERIDNKIVHVPAEKLQNKFNRYYVTDTLKLNNNQIFISEIDLNREYGKISEPHQAILRTATPVFSQSDEPAAGIIVINAEISHELEAIQKSVADSGRTIYITNDQGYYLLHPDPAKTFGFDKGTEELIQNDISSIAEFLSPDSKENNRFILPKHIESDSIYIFTKIFFDTLYTERYITVGIQEPYSIIKDRESSVLYNTLFSATIIIAFGIFLALIFSLKLLKPLKLITDTITNFVPGESPTQLLQINTNDEIGALSQAFRNMSDQVIDSQGNLINLNKNLEQLIDTRTNALSESKRMLQTILDTIPVRVYWKNINGEFMGCNSLFAKDTGLNSPQEVINKTDYDMPWKDHANSYKEKEQEIINNNSSFLHVEELQTHIDGTGKWIEYNKTPLTDTNNNIIGILGTYQDITLRKANELALIESESRQFAILQNMIDGVITINQYGIIQSFNNAAESIFGYTLDEVIGKNVSLLMPEPYKSSHDNYLNNYTTTGEAQIIGIGREVEGQRKNGDCFPLDLAVSEISSVDERLFVGIVRDITERQRIDKMKNEFISTVSHELRTPLTSIRGSLGLITGGAVGELPQQAREMLNIASNNTERLLMLINDILDIQKIESGLLTFKFNTIKLTPFLEQAIDNNKTYGNQYSVNFKLAHTIDNISVYADSDRLMQVMNNLMSNAAKFSPPNETVEISAAIHNDTIRISVTDNGPGIPEEFQPKLFDKFTQSDSSDNRAKEGTGLGLSITKMIVEKHGGRIGFISKQGIGTTFYFDLPKLTELDSLTKDELPKPLHKNHKPCILVVEDDYDIAALIERMISEAGYNCDIAYTAKEARQFLNDCGDQYRLMTLDIILPDEDGLSLLSYMRETRRFRDLPVVVVSVKADEAKRTLNGGAIEVVDWLSKPIDQERLQDVVKHSAKKHTTIKILHVEDEDDVHRVVSVMLQDHCHLDRAKTCQEARTKIASQEYDLVLLDIGLPDGSGLDLLDIIEENVQPPQVIIFSAQDVTEEYADKVSAVLVKSRTSNSKLIEIINSIID